MEEKSKRGAGISSNTKNILTGIILVLLSRTIVSIAKKDICVEEVEPVAKNAGKVALVTKDGLLIGLGASHECKLDGPVGSIVSMIAWGENAKIRTRGLKYPINNESLETGSKGISNEIEVSPSSIYVMAGRILLFLEKQISLCLINDGSKRPFLSKEKSF